MPQGSVTGRRPAGAGAGAGEASAPAIDVARLRVAIARLSRWLRRHELAGLTPTQLSALSTVDRIGPLRLGDLAAAEKIAPSTLTRLVTVLEESGYVERCPVPGDARASRMEPVVPVQAIWFRTCSPTRTSLDHSAVRLSRTGKALLRISAPCRPTGVKHAG